MSFEYYFITQVPTWNVVDTLATKSILITWVIYLAKDMAIERKMILLVIIRKKSLIMKIIYQIDPNYL